MRVKITLACTECKQRNYNMTKEKKFSKSKDQILQIGVEAVKYAKTLLPQVQYSTEDASRSDFEYLRKTIISGRSKSFGKNTFKARNLCKNAWLHKLSSFRYRKFSKCSYGSIDKNYGCSKRSKNCIVLISKNVA